MKFLAFDLDGVLVNSKGLHDYAFVQALLHCGMREAADAYRDAPMEEVSTRDKLVRLNVAHKYDEVKVAKDKVFLELVPKIEFSPFLALDLERATRHAPVIVVTNCTAWMAREICRHAGIGHVPLIAPEIGQPTKPDPYLYERAAEYFRLDHEGPWYAFEDSPSGLAAAWAAGGRAILTNYEEMKERLRLCAF